MRGAIARRRQLRIFPYKTLAEVGFDGDYVTPYQITSCSPDGPALVALHWLDEESVEKHQVTLHRIGYLPSLRFNQVLDIALEERGITRSEIYMTQAFHLIPRGRSEGIPTSAIDQSFDQVTRHELAGRRVLALGDVAARACARHGIAAHAVCHPSRRGYSNRENGLAIAEGLETIGF